ncbi:MAG: F420-nonreducing hydrogenase [Thermoprotei archaeon]|nr:MAG: F420-nonreducing hydrogenase [Thermoprotei archaeon]RLF01136.1 MAG: F420-nonreducing hydrogenase [Thermoprotei archaeon]HDI75378.1 F420-nonreducing hydrogenase [Thermoprotei archaeon]
MIRLALVSLSGYCSGCEVALADVISEVLPRIEIVYSTLIADIDKLPSNIDLSLVSGAVRTKHDIEVLREARNKSKLLVALGSCASFGGIPGLANVYVVAELLREIYGTYPREVPKLTRAAAPVSEYVQVDYRLPGCPPPYKLLIELLVCVDEKKPLPKPPSRTVCDECSLKKRDVYEENVYRLGERDDVDFSRCFLEQGILCMGIATASGCEAQCPSRGVPCRGCRGPPAKIVDQGERLLSSIASVFSKIDEEELVRKIPDPLGYFYRFTLPSSTIPYTPEILKRMEKDEGSD